MVEPIALLTTISVLLTFIGSYRFVSYIFRNDPLFATAVASGVTISYLVVFEVVVIALGVGVLASPIIVKRNKSKVREYGKLTLDSILQQVSKDNNFVSNKNPSTLGADTKICDQCGSKNDQSNIHCSHCGSELDSTNIYVQNEASK